MLGTEFYLLFTDFCSLLCCEGIGVENVADGHKLQILIHLSSAH